MKFSVLLSLTVALVAANETPTGFEPFEYHAKAEPKVFQTEVSRMMKLIINSLYKTKEIFLRELISNASDALEKIRKVSLTDPSVMEPAATLNITIVADEESKTLMIRDTGIGMTKENLTNYLGTIAKSGTADFYEKLESGKGDQSHLIGQFGVGFYSAFLVADKVTVVSKHPTEDQFIWASEAHESFTVEKDPRGNTLGRGTLITLYLKDDALEYLKPDNLKDLVKRYSEYINFPIYLYTTKTETVEEPIEEETKEDEDEEVTVEDADEKKTKTVEKVVQEFQLVNDQKPIWARDPKEIEDAEYNGFYKANNHDSTDPIAHLHFTAEGEVDFSSLLFVPSKAPTNIFQQSDEPIKNIKLYVRRVFITDELGDFIPRYLSFIQGLVDSDDLPLNVSRENLQKTKLLLLIKKKLIQKILELFSHLMKETEKYDKFFTEYGSSLKLGAITDTKNRLKLLKLLKFTSSKGGQVTLDEYVNRMKKGQDLIYYVTGPSIEEIESSPFIEQPIGRGYEVLYMHEPVDEYLMQNVHEFGKFKFQTVAKEGLEFADEEEKKDLIELSERFKPLMEYLAKLFEKYVEKVVISPRLVSSPTVLVAQQWGLSGQMEKIMASHNSNDPMMNFYAQTKKILEINPNHPLIEALLDKLETKGEDEQFVELVKLLYDSTLLRSGYTLKDTVGFAKRIEVMLRISLGVDLNAQAKVKEYKDEPQEEPVAEDEDLPPVVEYVPVDQREDESTSVPEHDEEKDEL